MPTTEQKKLGFWQVAVAGKDALDIPRGYASANKKGTYDRFTGFVSEFIRRCLRFGTDLNIPELEEDRKQISSAQELEGTWWKRAIKAGSAAQSPLLAMIFHALANIRRTVTRKALYLHLCLRTERSRKAMTSAAGFSG